MTEFFPIIRTEFKLCIMASIYLNSILNIVHEAGNIASRYMDQSAPTLKKDKSVLTKADRKISRLARRDLAKFLKLPNHILLDEEDPHIKDYLNTACLDKAEYIWSIDPVDGTRLYANKIPLYGVSLGLLRNKIPWLGAVYFPALKELFYCDGKYSYFVQDAFTARARTKRIKPTHQKIGSRSIFLCDDEFFKYFNWDYKDAQLMISSCAVVDLCWPAINRACGSIFCSHLWDLAGSWPIFHCAGLRLRSMKTGKVLDRLNIEVFQHPKKPWKVKEFYVLSSEENYNVLKRKITPRRN